MIYAAYSVRGVTREREMVAERGQGAFISDLVCFIRYNVMCPRMCDIVE